MNTALSTWQYHDVQFGITYPNNPWLGHRQFAYDYIHATRPRLIVELGTMEGNSLFAMCQAVKEGALPTRLVAVDTWVGDEFTGPYGPHVLAQLQLLIDLNYANLGVELKQMTFDEAAPLFEYESIDILHIDGSHKYGDVKHDFELWEPLVKPGGLIMIHDIAIVEYGVRHFWAELEWDDRFTTARFDHSCGLGLVWRTTNAPFDESQCAEWREHYGTPVNIEHMPTDHIRRTE